MMMVRMMLHLPHYHLAAGLAVVPVAVLAVVPVAVLAVELVVVVAPLSEEVWGALAEEYMVEAFSDWVHCMVEELVH